jgi:hypothetical protein
VIRNPEIAAVRDELERLGNVVAPHRDHLCVRLPLFASVRVRVDDAGRLDCEPMFGPLPRTPAVFFSTTLLTGAALGSLYLTGISPLSLGTAFLAIMSGLASAWRFALTESCVTRVQLLWAARAAGRRDGAEAIARGVSPAVGLRAAEVPASDLPSPQQVIA